MKLLTTQRLYLRPFKSSDLSLLYQLHANPEVAKTTIDGIQSMETVQKHLADFIQHQEKLGFSQWAVFEQGTDRFVGRAGLTRRTLNDEIGEQTEIRFAILPYFWGTGLASEIAMAVVDFARQRLQLPKIAAANSLTNEKSARVLIKCGFKYVKNTLPIGYGSDSEARYWELEF